MSIGFKSAKFGNNNHRESEKNQPLKKESSTHKSEYSESLVLANDLSTCYSLVDELNKKVDSLLLLGNENRLIKQTRFRLDCEIESINSRIKSLENQLAVCDCSDLDTVDQLLLSRFRFNSGKSSNALLKEVAKSLKSSSLLKGSFNKESRGFVDVLAARNSEAGISQQTIINKSSVKEAVDCIVQNSKIQKAFKMIDTESFGESVKKAKSSNQLKFKPKELHIALYEVSLAVLIYTIHTQGIGLILNVGGQFDAINQSNIKTQLEQSIDKKLEENSNFKSPKIEVEKHSPAFETLEGIHSFPPIEHLVDPFVSFLAFGSLSRKFKISSKLREGSLSAKTAGFFETNSDLDFNSPGDGDKNAIIIAALLFAAKVIHVV